MGRPAGAALSSGVLGMQKGGTAMSYRRPKFSPTVKPLSRRRFMQGTGLAAGAAILGAPYVSRARAADGIVWYSTSSARAVEDWANLFTEKTGVPVETFRSGGVKMAQKYEAEVMADQVRCSVMDSSVPGIMMDWAERGLLEEYESPEAAAYPEDVRGPGVWTPIKALLMVIAYNRDHIPDEEAPQTWEDVLDPKWKDKMVMADAAYSGAALHWFGALRKTFGKGYMEALSKQNVLLRQGSGATADTLVSGERPLSPMMLHYRTFASIDKGANLQVVFPDQGIPISSVVIGLPKDAPNPELGRKFIDFALSKEAQDYWQREHHTPSLRKDAEPRSREQD